MIELILQVLGTALEIWRHEQKHALMKKYLKLKEVIREERQKTFYKRDMVRYGNALGELRDLVESFSTFVKGQNSSGSS